MISFVLSVFIVPTLLLIWIFVKAVEGRIRRALLPVVLLIGASSFAVIGLLEMPKDAARLAAAECSSLRLRILGEIEEVVQTIPPSMAGMVIRGRSQTYSSEYTAELRPYEWRLSAAVAVCAAIILSAAAVLCAHRFKKIGRVLFCAALCALECAPAVFLFAVQFDCTRNVLVMRDRGYLRTLADALERSDLSVAEAAALVIPQVEASRKALPCGGLSSLRFAALDLLQSEGRSLDDSN